MSDARKFYDRLFFSDRGHFERIARALSSLKTDPLQGKPLKHTFKGKYSLAVGFYRIIYSIDRRIVTVYVVDIGHRRNIYLS